MSTAAIIAIGAPVLALALRLLGTWLWNRWTGGGALREELDENAKVVAHGNQTDINAVLDDRLNGVRH